MCIRLIYSQIPYLGQISWNAMIVKAMPMKVKHTLNPKFIIQVRKYVQGVTSALWYIDMK